MAADGSVDAEGLAEGMGRIMENKVYGSSSLKYDMSMKMMSSNPGCVVFTNLEWDILKLCGVQTIRLSSLLAGIKTVNIYIRSQYMKPLTSLEV